MRNSPLLSIRNATISFAKKTLFEDLNLNLFPRDRVCLIGKNGVGKTSLMNVIAGTMELDEGERWIMPSSNTGYLLQNEELPYNIKVYNYILSNLIIDEHKKYLVDIVCQNLQIDSNALTHNLSGGQKRRVNLAKALVLEPDILLLDEPTNHLDLNIIEWLENYLQSFSGALLVISHDRKFLEKVSNKVFWLRAGQVKINNDGYRNFDEWSENILEHEKRELANLEKKLTLESGWLQTGVTARRKRNVGRLHFLEELRMKLQAQKHLVFSNQKKIKLEFSKHEEDAPQVIASFNNVSLFMHSVAGMGLSTHSSRSSSAEINSASKNLTENHNENNKSKTILDKFSLKIIRGERIGIIGKNGSGKTSFLKMILGEIKPTSGTVKTAKDIDISYFDQERRIIKPNTTIQEILCDSGSDYVNIANGKVRHICGYLKDFLFDPKDVSTLAGTLSGGQQNRLLLAKTLANPGNFLILDEPTNDLDMDSLDMLQEYLLKYQGTLLIVSHDRDFLDNVATSILAFEGDGVVTSHIGGYSDYLEYKNRNSHNEKKENKTEVLEKIVTEQTVNPAKKFSYKHKVELEKLPEKIDRLEKKIEELSQELNETEDRNPSNLAQISIEIAKLQQDLDAAESRWIELEELKGV